MEVESVLLTGGRSSRMGEDKASLLFRGEPVAEAIAKRLATVSSQVTILGRSAINGFKFLQDKSEFGGPICALANFVPAAQKIFVVSCDLPLFDPEIVTVLSDRIDTHPSVMAVVPVIAKQKQPLVALYREAAFGMIPTVLAEGRKNMMAWLDSLWVERFEEDEFVNAGLDCTCFSSIDTPMEFESISRSL